MRCRFYHRAVWLTIIVMVTAGLLAACATGTPRSLPAPTAPPPAGLKTDSQPTPGPAGPSVVPPQTPPAAPKPQAQPAPQTGNFTLIRDVEYGRGGGAPLLLDIYLPKTPLRTPTPAVVWTHGGGWERGDKYPSLHAAALASRGFFVASINYRLSDTAPFPAAIEDCKCAVRWLRANAGKYLVDPDRIGVWGASAGGHLAMLVGTADESAGLEGSGGWAGYSSRVRAVCSFYGPSDFVTWYQDSALFGRFPSSVETKFLGGTLRERPENYRRASPVTWVSPDDPPLLLVHGDQDSRVPFKQSQIMHDAYKSLGLDVTLIKVIGAGHGFFDQPDQVPISPPTAQIMQAVYDFFLKHLKENLKPTSALNWRTLTTPASPTE